MQDKSFDRISIVVEAFPPSLSLACAKAPAIQTKFCRILHKKGTVLITFVLTRPRLCSKIAVLKMEYKTRLNTHSVHTAGKSYFDFKATTLRTPIRNHLKNPLRNPCKELPKEHSKEPPRNPPKEPHKEPPK